MSSRFASGLGAFAVLGLLLAAMSGCSGGSSSSNPPSCNGPCGPCGDCTSGTCVPLVAGAQGSPSCGAFVCDGVSYNCPTTCDADADCGSCGSCGWDAVAANTICTSYAAGSVGTPSCAPYLCDGANGTCPTTCSGTTNCGPCGTCADGVCTALTVGTQGTPTCAPYLCDGAESACPTSCDAHGDCDSNSYCSGTCQAKLGNGATCYDAAMCISNICTVSKVAGVCGT